MPSFGSGSFEFGGIIRAALKESAPTRGGLRVPPGKPVTRKGEKNEQQKTRRFRDCNEDKRTDAEHHQVCLPLDAK